MIWAFGDFELDTEVFELRRAGAAIAVSRLGFDLLRYLIEQRSRVVERDELQAALWPGESVVYSALARQVLLLRKALGDDASESRYIRTSHRRGYQFIGVVRESAVEDAAGGAPTAPRPGKLPSIPRLVIGRSDELAALKQRLLRPQRSGDAVLQVLTAVHGWPGVGKTTLAAVLAWDADVERAFPDGVLWSTLGQKPDVHSELAAWCRALGLEGIDAQRVATRELSERLSQQLRARRMLLIVDDVWSIEDFAPLRLGGPGCAMLVTSRLPAVADGLAHGPEVFRLGVLGPEPAFELLSTLVPDVARQHGAACRELVAELEGLPLALHVAGNLLKAEERRGITVTRLLTTLREDAQRILAADVPSDLSRQTTSTVAALLETSTRVLDRVTRQRFAELAPFAPKPAVFDIDAMRYAWDVDDPLPTLAELVDRGLLESVGPGRYQMHALLKAHAESLDGLEALASGSSEGSARR